MNMLFELFYVRGTVRKRQERLPLNGMNVSADTVPDIGKRSRFLFRPISNDMFDSSMLRSTIVHAQSVLLIEAII